MSAPRLTGRPRVEALVACGAHQIQTQGKCTREVGGRESGMKVNVLQRLGERG